MSGLCGAVSGADTIVAVTVRVTAVPILANRMLVRALRGLLQAHPGLRVELVAEPRDLSTLRFPTGTTSK